MTRQLDVTSEAEIEVFAAALRYERERPGLGFRFEADINGLFGSSITKARSKRVVIRSA